MSLTKIFKLLIIVSLVVTTACSSKKGDANVPFGSEDGPLSDVNFTYDSYSIDAVAKSKIDGNVTWLNSNEYSKVTVEGHCDERGTNEYNMALGLKRARAAYDELVGAGVPADKLSIVSYGEELPKDPSSSEDAYAKNRRVHFNVK